MYLQKIAALIALVLLWVSLPAAAFDSRTLSYGDDSRQKVDLYIPEGKSIPVTLVVVNGEHWDATPERERLPETLIRFWTDAGIRVAQVWYRTASTAKFPAQAEDLAAAMAAIQDAVVRQSSKRHYFCLLGHASGAHLASVVALESDYLAKAGVSHKQLAGVIAISGIYDLVPDYKLYEGQEKLYGQLFGSEAQRRRASPVNIQSERIPPFLILAATTDIHGYAIDARRLTNHLYQQGSRDAVRLLVNGADHDDLMKLGDRRNPAAHLVLDFLRVADLEDKYANLVRMESRWQQPPFTTEPFWDLGIPVKEYPMNDKVRSLVKRAFLGQEYRMDEWALTRFYAIDLFELLDVLGEENTGKGNLLELTNVRNEKLFWTLDELRPYRPVVVIGIDEEKNLFRATSFYLGKREYSWVEPEGLLPPMARSLGAFIYFEKTPPAKFYPRYQAQFALTMESFNLRQDNPLDVFDDLDPSLYNLITVDNGCTSCHQLRGVGTRAHHLTAAVAKPHGGYALPLVSYDPEVWKNFMFNQEAVAELIGVSPNLLPGDLAKQLYQLVEDERP